MEIIFKATRKKHSSGYRQIIKKGNGLIFDEDKYSTDGIWFHTDNGRAFFIDCNNKTGEFRLVIEDKELFKKFRN